MTQQGRGLTVNTQINKITSHRDKYVEECSTKERAGCGGVCESVVRRPVLSRMTAAQNMPQQWVPSSCAQSTSAVVFSCAHLVRAQHGTA